MGDAIELYNIFKKQNKLDLMFSPNVFALNLTFYLQHLWLNKGVGIKISKFTTIAHN